MRQSLLGLLLLGSLALAAHAALLPGQNRVMVLLDSVAQQSSYSRFFGSLRERGYELSFFGADDQTLTLSEYGQYLYDNLIILSNRVEEFGGLVDVASIVDFIDSGRNVIIAGDVAQSSTIRELAAEVGAIFEDKAKLVVDHLRHDAADSDHGRLIVNVASDQKDLLGSDKFDPVLFRGTSFTLKAASVESGLLFPILRARSSSYPQPRAVLVAGLQARNNARVVISGSTALFSDKLFNSRVESASGDVKADRSGNERFVTELSKWGLKERGVLRASNARHHRFSETVESSTYRVTDNVTFELDIEQWDSESGKWAPFVVNDVQLEFTMLDPYVRQFLKADKKGHYSLDFILPDQHGVYTFRVDYHKFGYSSVQIETRVPVRPFRHNEYERFIFSAYPYYAGSFSMLAGIIIFSFVFLYHRSK
eukprot:TRINITY_DN1628_c0_g1_i1.p1 TRINITY_DN1628_c0_g1~~TRINITY_DN1628_c0_g1_i1.p1  ORF type:complete len:423 (-),score=126.98 TRINITY_DN1628_c0_g1_i1:187-1455(-)